MDHNELRQCLDASFGPRATQARGLTFHLMAYAWPGGAQDRSDPAAPGWSRRPRAEHAPRVLELCALTPETCSCSTGRCVLCN